MSFVTFPLQKVHIPIRKADISAFPRKLLPKWNGLL